MTEDIGPLVMEITGELYEKAATAPSERSEPIAIAVLVDFAIDFGFSTATFVSSSMRGCDSILLVFIF